VLKDFLATCAGTPHTEGSRLLAGYRAPANSELVRRLRDAGAVIAATTKTPEFALISTTEPEAHGPCRNPWATELTCGGSSGGSATAVAAGAVPLGHGNDAGGSIRIPASCCGLFGLKPSRGRVSLAPLHGDLGSGFWAEHVLTRTVADSALVLDVTSGAVAGDPLALASPDESFRDATRRDPGRLRVAWTASARVPVDAACRRATEETARLLGDLGHDVVEGAPDYDTEAVDDAFMRVYLAGLSARVRMWSERLAITVTPERVEQLTWACLRQADTIGGADVLRAIDELQLQSRAVARFYEDVDVWLTPTLALPPVPLGWFFADHDPLTALERDGRFCPFTLLANVTGQPAASVPARPSDDGVPVGVHLTARAGEETTLFSLASQLEQAAPWPLQVPEQSEVHA
jgi:amidase